MNRLALLVALLIVVPASTAHAVDARRLNQNDSTNVRSDQPVVKEIRSVDGIRFTIRFYEDESRVEVVGKNTKDRGVNLSSLAVDVDRFNVFQRTLNFSAGESWEHQVNYEPALDALEKHHTIRVGTLGNQTSFNFTREIDQENTTDIPTPYISNVEIQNGTIDGHPSSVAKVTVINPSIQTYPTKLMVHTTGTDGSFYGASAPPDESRTITVELLDERGAEIAGEARLYAKNFTKGNGAFDQVEFVGRADEETESWNESYEPVVAPWLEDSYSYENESFEPPTMAEKLSGGRTLGGYPAIYVVGTAGIVVLAGLLRKRF